MLDKSEIILDKGIQINLYIHSIFLEKKTQFAVPNHRFI